MKILDETVDIKENLTLLFTEYRQFFAVLVISAILDAISTMYFMSVIGPEIEINLMVRALSYKFGIIIGPLIGKSIQIVAVWIFTIIVPRLTKFICTLIILVNLFAFVLNMAAPLLRSQPEPEITFTEQSPQ